MPINLKKKNYSKSLLTSDLAADGTSFTVTTGEGALFPATGSGNPFRGVFWAADKNSPFQDVNREIIECYRSAAYTITITGRAQEGTVAKAWAINDQFMLTLTTGTIDEIETEIATKAPSTSPTFATQIITPLIYGGAAANDDITIEGTSHATKTTSYVILQPSGGNVGIGTTGPVQKLDVAGNVIIGAGSYNPGSLLAIGRIDTNYSGAWASNIVLTGLDSSSISFHDSGARADTIRVSAGQFNIGEDVGYGVANTRTYGNAYIDGNVGIGTTSPGALLSVHGNALISNNLALAGLTGTSTLTWNGFPYTALTASTEKTDINFNLNRAVQFSSGNLSTQRAILIQAPTYSFTASSTLTDASTLAITGAPVAGTKATTTNVYGLNIAGGSVIGAGAIAPTNAYGLYVSAPTGATNNYGAVFATGNVGIGTTSPASILHVSSGATATTTVEFGAQSTSAKTCFNVRDALGAATSFYFVGTSMVVESGRCR